jgi:hypothetical protein
MYETAIPFPGIYVKEHKSAYNTDTSRPMFTAVLVTIAKL